MAGCDNGKVCLFGGIVSGVGATQDTWIFDPNTDAWTQLNPATKPSARYGAVMATAADGKVYLFGGSTGGNELWRLDPVAGTWTNLNAANPPPARYDASLAVGPAGKLYVFGGYSTANVPLNDTWVYDPASNAWTQLNPASKPIARYGASMAAAYDGKLYLFGGSNYDDTWRFDPSTNNWERIWPGTSPSARAYSPFAVGPDGRLYLFGGRGSVAPASDTWAFDVAAVRWTQVSTPGAPSARYGHGLARAGGSLYLFGGYDNTTNTFYGDTWVLSGFMYDGVPKAQARTGAVDVFIMPQPGRETYILHRRSSANDPLAYVEVGRAALTWSDVSNWTLTTSQATYAGDAWTRVRPDLGSPTYLVFQDRADIADGAEYSYLVTGGEGYAQNPEAYTTVSMFPPGQSPHGSYTEFTGVCTECHGLHGAPATAKFLKAAAATAICLTCHDGTGSRWSKSAVWPGSAHAAQSIGCISCHDPHGKQTYSRLTKSREEQGCTTGCHATVAADLSAGVTHPTATVTGRHLDTETLAGLPAANRHAECTDCHDPHAATAADPLAETTYVSVYRGVTPWTYTWSASGGTGTGWLEYRLCYKCHSGYWNKAGAPDKAVEFNPANPGYHPVETVGANTGIRSGAFVSPWSDTSRTLCADCHRGASAKGPHGSANAGLLAAPYPAAGPMNGNEVCFNCHKDSVYRTGADEVPGATPVVYSRFWGTVTGQVYQQPLHGYHVGTNGASCRTCHVSHGTPDYPRLLWTGGGITVLDWANRTCTASCHTVTSAVYGWTPAY